MIGWGVYDSIYDSGDAFAKKSSEQEKEKRKFEYKLREAYVDLAIPRDHLQHHLSVLIGAQFNEEYRL